MKHNKISGANLSVIVILSLLILGGAGFGVWSYMEMGKACCDKDCKQTGDKTNLLGQCSKEGEKQCSKCK